MKKCKLCDEPTKYVFNIKLEAIPICNDCANSIFLQQAKWYTELRHKYCKELNKKLTRKRNEKASPRNSTRQC